MAGCCGCYCCWCWRWCWSRWCRNLLLPSPMSKDARLCLHLGPGLLCCSFVPILPLPFSLHPILKNPHSRRWPAPRHGVQLTLKRRWSVRGPPPGVACGVCVSYLHSAQGPRRDTMLGWMLFVCGAGRGQCRERRTESRGVVPDRTPRLGPFVLVSTCQASTTEQGDATRTTLGDRRSVPYDSFVYYSTLVTTL